ncbi:MAG: transcriptional regulator [Verrucomicrobia bacterium]|nr:transcriptional regulator [Verrucomicrobiota bacterium]
MKLITMKRVTIVAEALLADRLQEDVVRLGASGYTCTDADGKGSRGVRASEWEGKNIKIECVVQPDVAQRILKKLADVYFEHFAVIAYCHDVEVVRGEKYS